MSWLIALDSGIDFVLVWYLNQSISQSINNKSLLWQVNSLGETAERLIQSHPEAVDDIQEKCTELNTAWSSLVGRADQRKDKLGNSHDLQRFLSDFRWGERTAKFDHF